MDIKSLSVKSRNNQSSYLFFLCTFLAPRSPEDIPVMPVSEWELLLRADPLEVTKIFLDSKLIQQSDIQTTVDKKFILKEIKEIAKQLGIKSSGTKSELVTRLVQKDYITMQTAVKGYSLLECSEMGVELSRKFLQSSKDSSLTLGLNGFEVSSDQIKKLGLWIIITGIAGTIGNRADEALLDLVAYISEIPSTTSELAPVTPFVKAKPVPNNTPSPSDSPIINATPMPRHSPVPSPVVDEIATIGLSQVFPTPDINTDISIDEIKTLDNPMNIVLIFFKNIITAIKEVFDDD